MDYEIQQVPEGSYAVVKRTVAFSEVPTVMPQLMGKVQAWADTVPHGQHVCISSSTPDGRLNIAPGVEVEPDTVEPPEDFDLVTRPAQRAAVHLYVGPYEGLAGVYREFYEQLQRDGYTEMGEPIEIYEKHDPVPETRIIWPVAT
jgi:predicted transcriptional regulator YdeE